MPFDPNNIHDLLFSTERQIIKSCYENTCVKAVQKEARSASYSRFCRAIIEARFKCFCVNSERKIVRSTLEIRVPRAGLPAQILPRKNNSRLELATNLQPSCKLVASPSSCG